MTKPVGDLELEDVLDAYMAEAGTPNWSTLAEWVRRYPQYEHELMEFAATWARMEWAPLREGNEVDTDTLVLRGMSVVQNLLHEHRQTREASSNSVPMRPDCGGSLPPRSSRSCERRGDDAQALESGARRDAAPSR